MTPGGDLGAFTANTARASPARRYSCGHDGCCYKSEPGSVNAEKGLFHRTKTDDLPANCETPRTVSVFLNYPQSDDNERIQSV